MRCHSAAAAAAAAGFVTTFRQTVESSSLSMVSPACMLLCEFCVVILLHYKAFFEVRVSEYSRRSLQIYTDYILTVFVY